MPGESNRAGGEGPEGANASRSWRRRGLWAAIVVGGVLVAAVAGHETYRRWALPHHLDRVKRHVLYRSAQPKGSQQWDFLRRHGIRTVINLREPIEDPSAFGEELQACAATGVRVISLPVGTVLPSDEQVLHFLQAVKWTPPVLVHCAQGRTRTGVMVAAYRVVMQGVSARRAEKDMLQHGWAPVGEGDLAQVRGFLTRLERDRSQWLAHIAAPASAISSTSSDNS